MVVLDSRSLGKGAEGPPIGITLPVAVAEQPELSVTPPAAPRGPSSRLVTMHAWRTNGRANTRVGKGKYQCHLFTLLQWASATPLGDARRQVWWCVQGIYNGGAEEGRKGGEVVLKGPRWRHNPLPQLHPVSQLQAAAPP
ncbi:hypothetical protein NDU88_000992 [Pleurodeles waltl]|uniref:Uncharacterized protein n=1 Tax=Pleurodeles waltl TaxID=8319 RepID=A0AAV7UT06_PLEWA|nr:hypothetical protein NDU88_000992 [Pleurodeles waltl]